jgi:hypothetical protein
MGLKPKLYWGGKRAGAGRPRVKSQRVRIWATVNPSTHRALSQAAFNLNSPIGTVIDLWSDSL